MRCWPRQDNRIVLINPRMNRSKKQDVSSSPFALITYAQRACLDKQDHFSQAKQPDRSLGTKEITQMNSTHSVRTKTALPNHSGSFGSAGGAGMIRGWCSTWPPLIPKVVGIGSSIRFVRQRAGDASAMQTLSKVKRSIGFLSSEAWMRRFGLPISGTDKTAVTKELLRRNLDQRCKRLPSTRKASHG